MDPERPDPLTSRPETPQSPPAKKNVQWTLGKIVMGLLTALSQAFAAANPGADD